MRNLARITEITQIEGSLIIKATPLRTSACINCPNSRCTDIGKAITVKNPENFELKPGSYVKIDMPAALKSITGLLALLVPLFMAVSGYLLSPLFAMIIKKELNEPVRFASALIFLLVSECLVLLISRIDRQVASPVITQLL